MFGFFSDVKKRIFAVEQKIEVIWQHLFRKEEEMVQEAAEVVDPNAGSAETVAAQQESSAMVVTEPTENGEANNAA